MAPHNVRTLAARDDVESADPRSAAACGDEPASPLALLEAGLDIAYQPIVHLGSGAVIAYEALARPRHPDARNPFAFFRTLEQSGLRLRGELAAFRAALQGADNRVSGVKLFLNASPLTLIDPDFDVEEFLALVEGCGICPTDVVIEVTESEEVDDLAALAQRAQRLRRFGIGLAVDDAGAGHASFRVITRLRPSYIKIDRDLVSNVDTDGARHAFIEALVRFSRQIGSHLIAEGIETQSELASLTGLGVEAGQGYFLARPALGAFVNPSPDARRMIASAAQRLQMGGVLMTVGDMTRPAAVMDAHVTVRDAYARFSDDPALGALVRVDGGRLVGQLTRRGLERLLAAPGAWDCVADRRACDFAEAHPLAVAATLDIVEVGGILAARPAQNVPDDIVVTDTAGRVGGVVRVRDVIRTLASMHRINGEDTHPITGLPGHDWLENELEARLMSGPVSVIVVDVDQFRLLNVAGGFVLGDEVLRALGRCLTSVVGAVPAGAAAHLGGDDFVLLVAPEWREEVVAEVVRNVENQVMPTLRVELRLHAAEHLLDQIGISMGAIDLVGSPPAGHRYVDWASGLLAPRLRTAQDRTGYSCVQPAGGATALTTWSAPGTRERLIAVGRVEPGLVLRALAMVDGWLDDLSAQGADSGTFKDRFPGPARGMRALVELHCGDLRERAIAASRTNESLVDVTVHGRESALLQLLDGLAVLLRQAPQARQIPLPPEVALVQRLVRQRARAIVREDVVSG